MRKRFFIPSPSPCTMTSLNLTEDPAHEAIPDEAVHQLEDGISLCLSGGGYRAMLFHVGAPLRLFKNPNDLCSLRKFIKDYVLILLAPEVLTYRLDSVPYGVQLIHCKGQDEPPRFGWGLFFSRSS